MKRHYRNLSEILKYDHHTRYIDASFACAMTKLNWQDFAENLKYEVARFPEKDEHDRVKHFYFQFYRKLVGAGEDRHRLFAWTVSPLWGQKLFIFEMKCIAPRLISFGFFIDFLKSVDRRALKVPIYGSWVNLNSSVSVVIYKTEKKLRALVRDEPYVYHLYKYLVRRLLRDREKNEKYGRLITEVWSIYSSSQTVREYFDRASIQKFLEAFPSTLQAYQLLTLMSYVAELESRFPEKISRAV